MTDHFPSDGGHRPADAGVSADPGADALLHVDSETTTLKRRSVHGAAATLASQAVRFLFQIVAQVALAHLVSPGDFGLVAMVTPLVGLVQLVNDLGLLEATIQRPLISHRELSVLFWISVAVSALLAALFAVASPLVGWLYGDPRATAVTICFAGLILLSGVSAQQMALLNRRMQFMHLAAIDVGATAVASLAGITAALLGCGYWSLVIMQTANSMTLAAMAWSLSRWRPSRPRWEPGVGSLLRFGGNVTGANVLGYLAHNLDNVLIGATSGSGALGLYDRAYRLMLLPITQVITPFSRVAVPLLSRLVDSPDRYRMAFARMVQATLLITTPGIVFAVVTADTLVPCLLGTSWRAAAPIFAWLGGGTLALPLLASTTWLFISQGRARQHLIWGSTGSGLIVLSFLVGLPWGPVGVATASTLFTVLLQLPIFCWAATREGPVRRRELARIVAPFAVAGLFDAVVLLSLQRLLLIPQILDLIGLALLSYAAHAGVLACLPAGRTVLREAWSLRDSFFRKATP